MLAPLVIWLWRRQAKRGVEPSDLSKIAIGCAVFAMRLHDAGRRRDVRRHRQGQRALADVLFHFICAIGYLFVFPVALALFTRAAPPAVNAMMAGVCYLSLFAGSVDQRMARAVL